jgi:hypothetical protein
MLAQDGLDQSGAGVADELGRRRAWIPDSALFTFGGQHAPWVNQYLHQLKQTPVSAGEAQAAKLAILDQDAAARKHSQIAAAGRSADLRTGMPHQMPDQDRWLSQTRQLPPLLEPPPGAPGITGPEPVR